MHHESDSTSTIKDDLPLFIRACYGLSTQRTPIWLMRQAGRYMAEYRAIRAKSDFWEVCHTPDLATEVTLQPINAFGFDASIIFSDLFLLFKVVITSLKTEASEEVITPIEFG